MIDKFRRLDRQLARFDERFEQLCFWNCREIRDKRSQKSDDADIMYKIAIDIPILYSVCDIQFKLNAEVHKKPIIQISEDFSTNLTAKFQS